MDPSDVTVAFGIFNIRLKDGRIFKQTGDVVAQAASNTGQKAVTIGDLASTKGFDARIAPDTKGFDARIAPDKGNVWQALDPKVKGQVWTQDASGKWLPSSQSAPPIPNGLQSSTFFQQVVAGKAKTTSGESMTSVHFETTDIDPLRTAGHPESELRSAIATTAAGQHEIDVYFYERGKLSKLPAGSNIVEGDPLPDRIGKFFPNQGKPPTTPSAPPTVTVGDGGVKGGGGAPTKAVVSAEVKAEANVVARSEAGLLARAGGVGGVVSKGLLALNIYFAYDAYREGAARHGTAGGILSTAGALAGGAPGLDRVLLEPPPPADPSKVWSAMKSGASPTSIGMGWLFGAFR
jgi:hypothetical protein